MTADAKKSGMPLTPEQTEAREFITALWRDKAKAAEMIADNPAVVNLALHTGAYPLHVAAMTDNAELLSYLILNGADARARTAKGSSALHLAAYAGCLRTAGILLGKGLDINAPEPDGFTPLMKACQKGRLEMVEFLRDNGANPMVATKSGRTARKLAEKYPEIAAIIDAWVEKIEADRHAAAAEKVAVERAGTILQGLTKLPRKSPFANKGPKP